MIEKVKILVIEDEDVIRNNISEILRYYEYDVIDVGGGEKGLEVAKSYCPDVILCDIMLPDVTGYEVLKRIDNLIKLEGRDQCHVQIKLTSFIFITAKASRLDYRIGMNLGADDYITKPFTSDELVNAIKIRIKRNEEVAQLIQKRNGLLLSKKEELDFSNSTLKLTKSEHKVLNLISEGLSTPQIAQRLYLSKKTIENHRANMTRKLHLKGSHSLTNFALRLNYS